MGPSNVNFCCCVFPPFSGMFEKNLLAMVKELREKDEVGELLCEIKQELSSLNERVKLNAIIKLGYLSMIKGYDMRMSYFTIIEIMASPQFALKRPAMFAATLAFSNEESNVSILTSNIFQKELCSSNYLEIGNALSCLASIVTEDIANATFDKVILLVSFSKPYIRKKVALTLFKLLEKTPNNFALALPKFTDLLSDPDQSVQSCCVTSLTELAKCNPKLVLSLVPTLFYLLKESKSNWMKIKLVKIFQFLAPVEPRLWGKLGPVVLELLESNKAKSVEMELMKFDHSKEHIGNAIQSDDFNIKWLGTSLIGKYVGPESDFFLQVLLSQSGTGDHAIRTALIAAIGGLVTTPSAASKTVQQLLSIYARQDEKEWLNAVLDIGQKNNLIEDVSWYLSILVLLKSDDVRIANQFGVFAKLNPEIGVRVAVQSLMGPKVSLLSSQIIEACIRVISDYALSNELPKDILQTVTRVMKSKRLYTIENTCCLLKIATASFLIQKCDIANINFGEEQCVYNVIGHEALSWIKTADPDLIKSIVFAESNKVDLVRPKNLNDAFIQLPRGPEILSFGSSYFD